MVYFLHVSSTSSNVGKYTMNLDLMGMKKGPLWLFSVFVGDEILNSYVGIFS